MALALYAAYEYAVNLVRFLLTNLKRITLYCVFGAKKRKNEIFMEATPMHLLLNKLHLFIKFYSHQLMHFFINYLSAF